jgi:hypothetical protein
LIDGENKMAMTKAEEMASRSGAGSTDWWDEVLEQVQVYFVFDDGSVLSELDRQPCRLEMRDGRVRSVLFDEIKESPEPNDRYR